MMGACACEWVWKSSPSFKDHHPSLWTDSVSDNGCAYTEPRLLWYEVSFHESLSGQVVELWQNYDQHYFDLTELAVNLRRWGFWFTIKPTEITLHNLTPKQTPWPTSLEFVIISYSFILSFHDSFSGLHKTAKTVFVSQFFVWAALSVSLVANGSMYGIQFPVYNCPPSPKGKLPLDAEK